MNENAVNGKPEAPLLVPLDGAVENGVHRFTARIYYADTDFSGAVYHARYLELFERGRSDFLRCLGVRHTELAGLETPLFWVVRQMQIDFLAAARIEDVVLVETKLAELHKARIIMAQNLTRDGKTLITARVVAALISDQGKPQRMPKPWVALFEGQLS